VRGRRRIGNIDKSALMQRAVHIPEGSPLAEVHTLAQASKAPPTAAMPDDLFWRNNTGLVNGSTLRLVAHLDPRSPLGGEAAPKLRGNAPTDRAVATDDENICVGCARHDYCCRLASFTRRPGRQLSTPKSLA
jgi:hypothetical protein